MTGGPYGRGTRIKLEHTRALVRAALGDTLAGVPFRPDAVFGVLVPESCPGVPVALLHPRQTWADPAEYDAAAARLAALFRANFEAYAPQVPPAVREAGPR